MHLLFKRNSENKFAIGEYKPKEGENISKLLALGYVEVSDDDYLALVNKEKCWDDNGKLVPYEKTQEEIEQKQFQRNTRRKERNIKLLVDWFDSYDLQVKQYERAVRLGLDINIHIDNIQYNSIQELDEEAQEKAAQLKALRNLK